MLVAIDAGHGHNTAGKRCPDDSMREWDFNSAVATKVCKLLNKKGINTYRSDDTTGETDIALITRTNNINKRNAKICVSIHANANTGKWNSANGIETYIVAKGGQAEKLANIVQKKLIEKTGLRNRGVKVGNLHMVRETEMSAILCECGFMDNKEEAKLLKSDSYRTKCAEAISDGILEFLNVKNTSGTTGKNETSKTEKKEAFEVAKTYKNGSTIENVYAETSLKTKIGSLNKYEKCECLAKVNGRYLVKYKVDGTNTYKAGFVKYSGGVK